MGSFKDEMRSKDEKQRESQSFPLYSKPPGIRIQTFYFDDSVIKYWKYEIIRDFFICDNSLYAGAMELSRRFLHCERRRQCTGSTWVGVLSAKA